MKSANELIKIELNDIQNISFKTLRHPLKI